jgi:hypothetical protein
VKKCCEKIGMVGINKKQEETSPSLPSPCTSWVGMVVTGYCSLDWKKKLSEKVWNGGKITQEENSPLPPSPCNL